MKEYFIFINNKKTGPYKLSELDVLKINKNTLVWTNGMDQWQKAAEVSEINSLLDKAPPPLPTHVNDGFYLYLKKNYKYIFLTFGISLIAGYYIHENFFDYWLTEQYNLRYDSPVFVANSSSMTKDIILLRDFFKILVWGLGIFIIPIFYIFKKKGK
ncbi:DUF4339 domain-containing protein [Galbibacter orientalis]|uniref:GYF domain-containing protein n=1 Tax=Galbibacter orientalis DSM 19592 TaxID=926559 RepID=I3C6Q2_9FLAO|nr:DUF4339 domain-containing protein [Galbibacter orientalis]EIJ39295.1 hypothetical protein JoomaDRAFT_2307 [Galbibacter orientalis DSM 19592]